MNKIDIFDFSIIGIELTISLATIQQIASIILLIFNILWILFKIVLKVLKYAKGETDSIDIEEETNEIENIIENSKKEGE